jgi:uncharacterized membrane protein
MLVLLLVIIFPRPVRALDDGSIGVLYVGCMVRSQPFCYMVSDPLFSIGFVIATLRDWAWMPTTEVHRRIRLYMPRTYSYLVDNYDVLVLANANRMALSSHISKLASGVEDGGMGFLMSGGWESFGGTSTSYPEWGGTDIERLLPVEEIVGIWIQSGRPVIDKPDHELIRSLPWNLGDPHFTNPQRWHHNPVKVRAGGEKLATVVSSKGSRDPLMVTWKLVNEARVFALTSEIHHLSALPSGQPASQVSDPWEYAIDFGGNLMIYLDNRPVPQDLALVHAVRSGIFRLSTRRSMLMGLLEFCESFGANTEKISTHISEMDGIIASARPHYLDFEFEEVLARYGEAEIIMDRIEEESIDLKNSTLFYIYLVEWLTVTGTGLICGFLLWTLMVRRSLYRSVQSTNFRNP